MNCRRARIKAVATLPPRRKTNNNKDDTITTTTTTTTKQLQSDKDNDNNITETEVQVQNSPQPQSQAQESVNKSDVISNTESQNPEENHTDVFIPTEVVNNKCLEVVEAETALISEKLPVINNETITPVQKSSIVNFEMSDIVPESPLDVGIRPLNSQISNVNLEIAPVTQELPVSESEILNTECNFDPIIPLPAIKNRPKLKPTPRFAVRRNSVQASDLEDDKKMKREEISQVPRMQRNAYPILSSLVSEGRVRNESICSTTGDSIQPLGSMTPRYKISRTWKTGGVAGEVARRAAAKKKALEKPPHNALTMYDLIFYNPPNNSLSSATPNSDKDNSIIEKQESSISNNEELDKSIDNLQLDTPTPVPQVKIGPDGDIIIDEKSLVIETTDTIRSRELLSKCSVVYDNDGESNTKGLYRRVQRTRDWGRQETLRFYRALNTLGTDFSLMLGLFPGRSRRDLKVKFKKEERLNGSFVDRALMNPLKFDLSELEKQLAKENEEIEAAKKKINKLQDKSTEQPEEVKKKRLYRKTSLAAQCIDLDENLIKKSRLKPVIAPVKYPTEIREECNTPKNYPQLSSPQKHLPPDLKSGSMVVFASDAPGEIGNKIYQAFIVNIVDGLPKLNPLNMPPDVLQNLASKINVIDVNSTEKS